MWAVWAPQPFCPQYATKSSAEDVHWQDKKLTQDPEVVRKSVWHGWRGKSSGQFVFQQNTEQNWNTAGLEKVAVTEVKVY